MRSEILSHILPPMASASIAGIVDFGLSKTFLCGAGAGCIASSVYRIAHDILAKTALGKNRIVKHSLSILASAGATSAIAFAAAADGLIVMPSLASMGAFITIAIAVSMVFRRIMGMNKKQPLPVKKPAARPVQQQPLRQPIPRAQPPLQSVPIAEEIAKQQRFKNDAAMRTAAPLLTALQQNKTDLAEWLLTENADVNCQNEKGETPLSTVVSRGQRAMAEKLIAKGAKLDCIDQEGNRLVHQAAKGGDIQLLKKFMNPTNREARNAAGCTPLACAVLAGKLDMAQHLEAQGANVETLAAGSSLVHHAAVCGDVSMIEWVLGLGLTLGARNERGYSALSTAVEKENLAAARRLIIGNANSETKTAEDLTLFHLAVLSGKLANLQWALDNAVNYCDRPCKRQMTPFSLAVSKGYLECAKKLFTVRPNVQTRDQAARTVLHQAVQSGNMEVLRWVLTLQDPGRGEQDRDGYTPVLLAAENGNLEMARCLADCGEDVGTVTNKRQSLLHLAASSGKLDLIRWALTLGLPLNASDRRNYTPLSCAVEKGHREAAKLLIASGAQ
ncbi:MAG: ankyrin repeat domain-containing protein [Parachlamydia sp.]|nr:ankyrin repeat domain-containing protein [Parachlamydia sp.]